MGKIKSKKIYIDRDFFHQLKSEFGTNWDQAIAYVTTHEVNHHAHRMNMIQLD